MYHHDILAGERPFRAFAAISARYDRNEIEALTEALIEHLDGTDDHEDVPDFRLRSDGLPGDPTDHEPSGDERDCAWIELRECTGKHPLSGLQMLTLGGEDDEEAGDETDCNGAEDEDCAWFALLKNGPGCNLADPDKGADDDGEETQMEDSFWLRPVAYGFDGPGCVIADPDCQAGIER